ncbi:hypothetical protein MNBD_ALPHA08-1332 [hydrothermal vent metagenome]|uniref:Uncharacterized protein n=1 Tax=hydrothermal vent metagenome TaxID=652676 RepID=A0A3B0S4P2_9ZZZZ
MIKKSLVIATAMFAAVVGLQPTQQAEAKVKFNVHIGIPGGFYGGPGYGGGYYGGGYGGGYSGGWAPRRINCNRGRRILRNNGYKFIKMVDCAGRVYKYKASRGGKRYLLKMKSRNGRVFSRRFI